MLETRTHLDTRISIWNRINKNGKFEIILTNGKLRNLRIES